MNEDYLWSRTGDDPEIKKLEDALEVFRNTPSAAPLLPSRLQTVPVSNHVRPFWMRLIFAGPAVASVLAGLVAWSVLSSRVSPEQPLVHASQNGPSATDARPAATDIEEFPPAGDEAPKVVQVAAREPERKETRSKATDRKLRNTGRIATVKPAAPAMTREEKYAYDRLMLALSITGSKLKMVKDAVEGTENESMSSENSTR